VQVETVAFDTADGLRLEGRFARPHRPLGGAILCHPHPLYQGSMSSSIVPALQRALSAEEWASLRFNFRGVGRSEGVHAKGIGEKKDALAALDAVASRLEPGAPLAVAGWSFGALVGLAAAVSDPRVETYVAIAPPVTTTHDIELPPLPPGELLRAWGGRALAICGTEDPFCRPKGLEAWAAHIPDAKVEVMEGQSHFFSDALDELAARAARFIARGE
jgi:hypothetical protein